MKSLLIPIPAIRFGRHSASPLCLRRPLTALLGLACLLALAHPAAAQFGQAMPSGPDFFGGKGRVFGDHRAFSANMVMATKDSGQNITMEGRMSFDDGKNRFEMDMSRVQGMKGVDAKDLKEMGMDKMVVIARPDKKLTYQVWPGMSAYVETPIPDTLATENANDYKIDVTAIGKETIDGHPCEKNKVVVTGKNQDRFEATLWNATDLKGFPIQIENSDKGQVIRITYKDVNLAKPDASQFEPPTAYRKYSNMQDMMMKEMMQRENAGQNSGDTEPAEAGEEKASKENKKKKTKIRNPFGRNLIPGF